jgi:hypothetical protein
MNYRYRLNSKSMGYNEAHQSRGKALYNLGLAPYNTALIELVNLGKC